MAMTAFRNKYDDRCCSCRCQVAAGDGWTTKTGTTWVVYCEDCAKEEGLRTVKPPSRERSGAKGVTLGKSVRDTWVHVFAENERRYADHAENASDKPWDDERISHFMRTEFPDASVESRSVERVRMYRRSYNRGAHSFEGLGVPDPLSWEYDKNGERVPGSNRAAREIPRAEVDMEKVDQAARAAGRHAAEEYFKTASRPIVKIEFSPRKVKTIDAAGKHAKFVDVLKRVEAGLPVLLVGPSGCGKTHLAGQVAEALDLEFTFNSMSEGVNESALLGRTLPDAKGVWKYMPSPFVKAFRDGGLHLLDEIDAADPNLLVTVNAAIANGVLSVPFAGVEPIRRHKDCVIVAAANTYGNGADRQYVGRNQLDAATVNRFTMGTVEMDYDEKIERAIVTATCPAAQGAELLSWAWQVRRRIAEHRLRRIMSTRNIEDAAKLIAVGLKISDVADTYFAGWGVDEARKARV